MSFGSTKSMSSVATPHLGCALLRHLRGIRPVVIAGSACQPWSQLGDGHQHADPRAGSLHAILRLTVQLQAPCAVLENVTQCWDDPHTRQLLDEVCKVQGWTWHLIHQRLQDDWAIHRTRGWVFLGPASLAEGLRPLPPADFSVLPKHVLPKVPTWPADQREPLQLTKDEQALYLQTFAKQDYRLKPLVKPPTLLHSLGNVTTACACGCRPTGLTLGRLQARGLTGLLVEDAEGIRFIHPAEAALLQAASLPPSLCQYLRPSDIRLMLSQVGQLASPLHAGNLALQLAQKLHPQQAQHNRAVTLLTPILTNWRTACRNLGAIFPDGTYEPPISFVEQWLQPAARLQTPPQPIKEPDAPD